MVLSDLRNVARAGYCLGMGHWLSTRSYENKLRSIPLLEKGVDYLTKLYQKHPRGVLYNLRENARRRIRDTRHQLRDPDS